MNQRRVRVLRVKSGLTPAQWKKVKRKVKEVWKNTPKNVRSYIVERNLWN